jgi:hypothetical protein
MLFKYTVVETGNNLHTGRLDCDWLYPLKILAHFRPKVLVDFLHSFTQINCLTGAIIARHIIWTMYIFKKQLCDPPHSFIYVILWNALPILEMIAETLLLIPKTSKMCWKNQPKSTDLSF